MDIFEKIFPGINLKNNDSNIFICNSCGEKGGKRARGIATWHTGICEICKQKAYVTQKRDFT